MKPALLSAFLLFPAAPAYPAAPENTAAVLSLDSGAYLEAFSAFQAAYGGEVVRYDLSRQKPVIDEKVKLLVTFGGKAAGYSYPAGINIIYCLAPGLSVKPAAREAREVRIALTPAFPATLAKIRRIQPGLKHLRILWSAPGYAPYEQAAMEEGARQGVQVTPFRLEGPDSLPGALRGALGEADALWLPPDPLIVTKENLRILREFSWDNNIPFYGSTKSMTREGALASFGISFAEIGKAAARAAAALDRGEAVPGTVYPERTELTLNAAAAKKLGIEFPGPVLDEAGYLFP
ncbi:MAG: hypothetical protein HY550_11050 [Elusimicrobia bacterium]|nr:hypothetical protein [Elusimicrobiota bacterium]